MNKIYKITLNCCFALKLLRFGVQKVWPNPFKNSWVGAGNVHACSETNHLFFIKRSFIWPVVVLIYVNFNVPKLETGTFDANRDGVWLIKTKKIPTRHTLYTNADWRRIYILPTRLVTQQSCGWVSINHQNQEHDIFTLPAPDIETALKRRHLDVVMSKWRRFDVVLTSVPIGQARMFDFPLFYPLKQLAELFVMKDYF